MFETALGRSRNFILCNARLLERRYLPIFSTADPREPVLRALQRLPEPGWGNSGSGLEPDKRCEASQPVDVEMAFHILDLVNGFDDPMVAQACDFLMSITTAKVECPSPWQDWRRPRIPPGGSPPTRPSVPQPDGEPGGAAAQTRRQTCLGGACSGLYARINPGFTSTHFHDVIYGHPLLAVLPRSSLGPGRIGAHPHPPGGFCGCGSRPERRGYAQFPIDFAPRPTARCAQSSAMSSSSFTCARWQSGSSRTAAGRSPGRRSARARNRNGAVGVRSRRC